MELFISPLVDAECNNNAVVDAVRMTAANEEANKTVDDDSPAEEVPAMELSNSPVVDADCNRIVVDAVPVTAAKEDAKKPARYEFPDVNASKLVSYRFFDTQRFSFHTYYAGSATSTQS